MACNRSEQLMVSSGSFIDLEYVGVHVYESEVKDVILALKYQRRKSMARHVGEVLAVYVNERDIDVITWAPTSDARVHERGFDQSELIARHCAAVTQRRHLRLLRRVNDEQQTGNNRLTRLIQPQFVARPIFGQPRVCVIDDVMTTGATLGAASRVIGEAGASFVLGLSFAYVPNEPTCRAVREAHG